MLKNNRGLIWVLLGVAAVAGAFYYKTQISEVLPPSLPPPTEVSPSVALAPPSAAAVHYPVPSGNPLAVGGSPAPVSGKLPELDESDEALQNVLSDLMGKVAWGALFNPTGLVRKLVVSIDSATAEHPLSSETSVFVPLEKGFRAEKHGKFLDPANYERYRPYVSLARNLNTQKLVSIYFHFYPLFQAAYKDINPKKYFNDRLVEVIDSLTDAPEVKDPIPLTLDSVRYKFADSELEARPIGQKILIRMGTENARVIKNQLRKIRALITQSSP